MAQGFGGDGCPGKGCGVGKQRYEASGKRLRRKRGLFHDPAAAAGFNHKGIVLLIGIERAGQRDQDRGTADDGEFGNGRGAGAADDEMALGDALGQIGEKGREFDAGA